MTVRFPKLSAMLMSWVIMRAVRPFFSTICLVIPRTLTDVGGIEGRGVLVQQEQFGPGDGRHEQRRRLTLPSGEQAHLGFHPVLEPEVEGRQQFAKIGGITTVHREKRLGRVARIRHGEVFFDGHAGRGPALRILKEAADVEGPFVVLIIGNILSVQNDPAAVGQEFAQDRIEESGFARAVGPEDRDELALPGFQRKVVQRDFFVGSARLETFGEMADHELCAHRAPRSSERTLSPERLCRMARDFSLISGSTRATVTIRADSSLTV